MSGRGNGSGRGRGRTRGTSRNGRSASTKKSTAPPKKEMKFTTQTPGNTVYESYATVREHILQRIQKNYDSGSTVAKVLKTGKTIDWDGTEPKMQVAAMDATITDMVEQTRSQKLEQDGFNIAYHEKLRRHLDKKDEVEEGLRKAYTEIFMNFCTKSMQQRIEEHPDFDSTIEDNPIELLEVIKQLQHSPMRARHPLIPMVDALQRFTNMKQMENEDLHGYATHFKQNQDVLKAQLGTRFLDGWTKSLPEYQAKTDDEKEAHKDTTFDFYCVGNTI